MAVKEVQHNHDYHNTNPSVTIESHFADQKQHYQVPSTARMAIGLQWEFIGAEPIDLDVSCVAFGAAGNAVEAVFFNNLTSAGK